MFTLTLTFHGVAAHLNMAELSVDCHEIWLQWEIRMVAVHGVALSSKEIVIWSSLGLVDISLAPAVIYSTI